MSLSDLSESSPDAGTGEGVRWGTIFMGPDESRESRMDKVLNQHECELWNRSTEHAYMRRVRERATIRAQDLIDKAQTNAAAIRAATMEWASAAKAKADADLSEAAARRAEAENMLAEAEALRESAYQDGYQAAHEAALADIEAGADVRGAAAAAVIERMRAQCSVIFDAWRDELAALTCDAVEAAIGWTLDAERTRIVTQVLVDAARTLEGRQRVSLHVHPEDVEFFEDVLGTVRERLGAESWSIQANVDVEPGGMRLESDYGRVEAYPSMRRAIVDSALLRLTLPSSDADDAACAAVNAPCPELDLLPPPIDLNQLMAPQGEDSAASGAAEADAGDSLDEQGHDVTEGYAQADVAAQGAEMGPEAEPLNLSNLSDMLAASSPLSADIVPGVSPDLLASLVPMEALTQLPAFGETEGAASAPVELASSSPGAEPVAAEPIVAEPVAAEPIVDELVSAELGAVSTDAGLSSRFSAMSPATPDTIPDEPPVDVEFRTLDPNTADADVDAVIELGPDLDPALLEQGAAPGDEVSHA